MTKSRARKFYDRTVVLLLFACSLFASIALFIAVKDIFISSLTISQSPRVLHARVDNYIGESRYRTRKVSSVTYEYTVSGDGRSWLVKLPAQVDLGSYVTITYALKNPDIFTRGEHQTLYSLLKEQIWTMVFFGALLAATFLFGYGVYDAFKSKN